MKAQYPNKRPPAVLLLDKCLKNCAVQRKRLFYKWTMFAIVFIAYFAIHLNKRSFIIVKDVLSPDCSGANETTACVPWKPFASTRDDMYLYSILDFIYMITYAFTLLISGYIAEHMDLRVFLSCGMLATGVCTALFGFTHYLRIHSLAYFVVMQILGAIVHSTGVPCVTEVIGSWFPEGKMGLTFGLLHINSLFSKLAGSAILDHFQHSIWGFRYIIPALVVIAASILVYFCLVPSPRLVNLDVEILTPVASYDIKQNVPNGQKNERNEENMIGIGFCRACGIPGIWEYAACTLFVRLIGFTFVFWLAFFVQIQQIGGNPFTMPQAMYYSTYYELGGTLGGLIAGLMYDYTNVPGIITTTMLICAAPNLFLFMIRGTTIPMFAVYMALTGMFTLGPTLLIVQIMSTRFASRESAREPNLRSIAVITSILDAFNAAGASIGPLLAGFVYARTDKWLGVVLVMIISDVFAVLALSRQFLNECRIIRIKMVEMRLSEYKAKGSDQVKGVRESDRLLETIDES